MSASPSLVSLPRTTSIRASPSISGLNTLHQQRHTNSFDSVFLSTDESSDTPVSSPSLARGGGMPVRAARHASFPDEGDDDGDGSSSSPRPRNRKRNARGALLGENVPVARSRLACVSPLVAESPSLWSARDTPVPSEDDDSDQDSICGNSVVDRDGSMEWARSLSPAPPALTDGTTSTSSSVSTSLSSHGAEGTDCERRSAGELSDIARKRILERIERDSKGNYYTPQPYKHVRPLQAAFMSIGLVSKRATRGRRNSSAGALQSAVLAQAVDVNATHLPRSMNGSASETAVASLCSMPSQTFEPFNPQMPGTPVKRPLSTSTSHQLQLQRQRASAELIRRDDDQAADMPGVVVNFADGHSADVLVEDPSPPMLGSSDHSDPPTNDVSPTIHASKRSLQPAVKSRVGLFRRRSSHEMVGSNFSEPMTPTRSHGQPLSPSQLLTTPAASPDSASPSTPQFPTFHISSAPQPLPSPSEVGRQSFPLTSQEQLLARPTLPPGRPQFRQRHSGSTVLSVRQAELQQPDYFESNYNVIDIVGRGEFSEVYRVEDKQRPGVFAVKRTKQPFAGPRDRLRRLEEVDVLKLVSGGHSSHIVSFVDAWEQSRHLFIETELCESGTLAFFLEEYGRTHEFLDETRIWKILVEIGGGVAHLHTHNVIHLDLKPANVFVTANGRLKIGDFGLASRWPRTGALGILRGAALPSSGGWTDDVWHEVGDERRTRAKSGGDIPADFEREGDREYIAPEILAGRYGKEADIFSLGLIILESAANVVLPDNGPSWQKLRANCFDDVNLDRLSEELKGLIFAMLQSSPDLRITIDLVVQHPIISRLRTLANGTPTSLRSSSSGLPVPSGAILPERNGFLTALFESVYSLGNTSSTGHEGDDEGDAMDVD